MKRVREVAIGFSVVLVLLGGACSGGDDDEASSDEGSSVGSPVEAEVSDYFQELGATDEEAQCLASELSAGAGSFEEVNDKTASYDSFEAVLDDLAPDCASRDRYRELAREQDARFGVDEQAVQEGQRDVFVGQFIVAGATEEEAACMADALVATSPDDIPPIYGPYEPGASELAIFDECGSPDRVAALYVDAYRAPLRAELVDAGASEEEATCILESIDQVDLFFPSEDFHGDSEAQMTADLFARDAAHCASEEQLRAVGLELHRLWETEN